MPGLLDDAGQVERELRAFADCAGDPDIAVRLLDEAEHLAESEAAALADILRGEERLEGVIDDIRAHTDAGIGNRDQDIFAGDDILRQRRALGAAAVMLILAVTGMAKFAFPQQSVPIDRLLTNTTAYITEHPGDAMGPYTLARIHYLALATHDARIAAYETSPAEVFPPRSVPSTPDSDAFRQVALPPTGAGPQAWTEAQLREHLKSVIALMRAFDEWQDFYRAMQRSLPKQVPVPLLEWAESQNRQNDEGE